MVLRGIDGDGVKRAPRRCVAGGVKAHIINYALGV